MKKRILLTGASGFVGENFCYRFKDEYTITGIYYTNPLNVSGVTSIQSDLTINDEINRLINKIKPEAVIHLMAVSDPNFCELNPDQSYKVNVEVSTQLAEKCRLHDIKYVFASTDLVFDGNNAPYSEYDEAIPLNKYGEHKHLAENKITEINPDSVICRLPLMYGPSYNSGRGLLEPMLTNLKNRQKIKLFTDEFRTPVSAESASGGLVLAMENGNGIIHLGGDERISRYELGKVICDIFGYDSSLFSGVLQKDVKMAAERPHDVSLINTKARSMGWQPGSLREDLLKYKSVLNF